MSNQKRFGIVGVAGYIAPRHIKAIKETGNDLVAALDRFDSVGILDSYFPEVDFFQEPERFDRYLDKKRRTGEKLDFISICSPNYLHDAHIRMALRNGADAICEKPLVLNPWNVDALKNIEAETGQHIYTVLQLRLHPAIIKLKEEISNSDPNKIYDIDLTYITSRGRWYFQSWKGDISKSGGIATNIGIHFFDMLTWIFGEVDSSVVHKSDSDKAAGFLQLKRARVRWFLSLDYSDIPVEAKLKGMRTFRSITIEGKEIEFSGGFTDLHTETYHHILRGEGFSVDQAKQCIALTHDIRNAVPVGCNGNYHPMLKGV